MSWPTTDRTSINTSDTDTLGNAGGVGIATVLDQHDADLTAITERIGKTGESDTATVTGELADIEAKKIEGVGVSKVTVGTIAPSSPAVGDIWIDTN